MKIQDRPGFAPGMAPHFARRRTSSGCIRKTAAASERESVRICSVDERLDVLRLEPLRLQPPEAHLVELIGDEIEDVLPVGLGSVATVAVMTADLFEVVVQVAHGFPLRGR